MSFKEELKEEAGNEKRKLKEMSRQDKLWYIWEYYKFHIAAVIGAIFLIYIIGTSIYNSTKETMVYCAVVNNYSEELNTDAFTVDFHDAMGYSKKQEVNVESLYATYDGNASELVMATLAKLSALVAAQELDVMIADAENIDHYEAMDGFGNLEEILPAELLDQVQDLIYYSTASDGSRIPVAIDISGTAFAQNNGITLKPAYFSILVNTKRMDHVLELLRYILTYSSRTSVRLGA